MNNILLNTQKLIDLNTEYKEVSNRINKLSKQYKGFYNCNNDFLQSLIFKYRSLKTEIGKEIYCFQFREINIGYDFSHFFQYGRIDNTVNYQL